MLEADFILAVYIGKQKLLNYNQWRLNKNKWAHVVQGTEKHLPDTAFICPKKTPLGNLCLFSSTEKKMLKKKNSIKKIK